MANAYPAQSGSRIFRRYRSPDRINPSELDPFGISQSDNSAKADASSFRNSNQFMLSKSMQPWINRLLDAPSQLLRPWSRVSDVSILKDELDQNPDLIGQPLKELDPYYISSNTYITITNEQRIHRFSSEPSLGIFAPESEVRKSAVSTVCNLQFQSFIIAVIVLDFLSLVVPTNDFIVDIGNDFFLGVYLTEVVIKMIAYGVIMSRGTYLRTFYGCIEFIVVISSIVPLLAPNVELLSELRVIRVIRLIRIIGTLKFTRTILEALVGSIKDLVPVFALFFVAVSFISLISLVFFNGLLLGKCVRNPPQDMTNFTEYHRWTEDPDNWLPGPWGSKRCPVMSRKKSEWNKFFDDRHLRQCPGNYSCRITHTGNPDMGYTNYDTLLLAMLTTFRLLCQDWWDNLFVQVSLVAGAFKTTIFFVCVILFGSHFIINLLLSTITLAYQRNELAIQKSEDDIIKLGVIMELNRDAYKRRQIEIYHQLVLLGWRNLVEPKFLRNLKDRPVMDSQNIDNTVSTFIDVYKASVSIPLMDRNNPVVIEKPPGLLQRIKNLIHCMAYRDDFLKELPIDTVACTVIIMNIIEMVFAPPPTPSMQMLSDITNLGYTIIFTLEAVVKLYSLKISYLNSVVSRFDLFIACLCLLELTIPGDNSKLLILLRMTRLLRLLKLARISKELEKLLTIVIRSFLSEVPLIILSGTIIFISAGIGMVLFQKQYIQHVEYQKPTQNFVDFLNSILLVFRIMCGEWVENLWVCMKIQESSIKVCYCIAYFLINQIVVSLVVFQLFIGILLNKFAEYRENEDEVEIITNSSGDKDMRTSIEGYITESACVKLFKKIINQAPSETSCFGRFRISIRNIVCCKEGHFSKFIIIMTILSSTALILDDYYLSQDKELSAIYTHLEIVFFIVFLVEMLLKIVAYGPISYVASPWRILDGSIVAISGFDLVTQLVIRTDSVNMAVFRVFRTLRCLRVLRTANVWQGFKLTVNALFRSVGKLFFVLLIVIIIWLMFALTSTSLFSSKLHYCENTKTQEVFDRAIVANKSMCNGTDMKWKSRLINFDTTPSALLALLEIGIFKGWIDVFQYVSDAPPVIGLQPKSSSNSSPYLLIYVAFIIIGSFFMLGMLVGVIVDSFEEERRVLSNEVLTEGQKKLQNSLLHCLMFPIRVNKATPDNRIGEFCKKFHEIVYVELFYLLLILAGTVSMSLQYHPGKSRLNKIYLPLVDDVILACFGMELVTRILAEESQYFQPFFSWNLLDFVVVMLSVAAKIGYQYFDLQYLRVVRFARVFRMGRLLAKFSNIKAVRNILLTVVVTLPSMLNIIALLIMAICVFAIVGVNLFNDQEGTMDHPFNEMFNFRTFSSTWRMLFIVSTAAGFNDYLHASMLFKEPFNKIGLLFWMVFLSISFFVLTNLLVSAVVSSYTNVFDDDSSMIELDTAETLISIWNDFDRDCTGLLPVSKVSDLLSELTEPLRVAKPNTAIVSMMEVPLSDDFLVSHTDLVKALINEMLRTMGEIGMDDSGEKYEIGDQRAILDTKIYRRIEFASNFVKYCWWRKKLLKN